MKKLDLWRRRVPPPSVPPPVRGEGANPRCPPSMPMPLAASRDATPSDDEEDTVPAAFYHPPE